MLNKVTLYQLSFIKLLYDNAIKQSYKSEPTMSGAILTFHDIVALFLFEATKYKGIRSRNYHFLDYWNAIPELKRKTERGFLNKVRNSFKHHAISIGRETEIKVLYLNDANKASNEANLQYYKLT